MGRLSKIFALAALTLASHAAAATETPPKAETAGVTLGDGFVGAYLSGQFAKSNGDLDKAIHYLRQIYDDHPHNADIASQLQNMLLLNGQIGEAIAVAEAMPPTTPENAVSALLLALRSARQNNMEQAGLILKDTFNGNNGQLWLPLVSAWLDAGQKRLKKPLTASGLAIDAGRASALIRYHLALINAYAGFPEAAALDFKNVIDDPANPPAHVMDRLLQFYRSHGQPETLTPLVQAYLKNNPATDAAPSAAAIVTPQDGIAEVLFTMGSVMQGAGVIQDAIIYLHLARYLKSDFPLAAMSLAGAYSDFKQYRKANAIYKGFTERSPFYANARLRLAMNAHQTGEFDEAISLLDGLLRKQPDAYDVLVAKGDFLRTRLKFDEAINAYSQALKQAGTPEEQHWALFFARGVCLERLGKWKAAEQDFQQALALKPGQPDVLNYLGYGWLTRRENVQEARQMIERAINARPNDPQIVDSMGWALFSLGQYGEALAYLEKALELLPADPTINDHLGDTYWYLGRKVEARYQWERALTFSPEADDAEAIHKKLKEGLSASREKVNTPVIAEGARPDTSVP